MRLWAAFLTAWLAGRALVALVERYYAAVGQDVQTHLLLALVPGSVLGPLAVWWQRRRLMRR